MRKMVFAPAATTGTAGKYVSCGNIFKNFRKLTNKKKGQEKKTKKIHLCRVE